MALARALSDSVGRLGSRLPDWAHGSWNPIVCGGTALPPNLLLSGKLLALWLMVHRGPIWRPRVHLPFLHLFDRLGPWAPLVEGGMTVAFVLFFIALLLNRFPRSSCFALGLLVLLAIGMDRTTFSNNSTLAGAFLLLLGLHEPGRPPLLLRAQIVLAYLGAGLNKLLDPDWQSGVFFEYWTRSILEHGLYVELASLLPPLLLSKLMCWSVIVIELGLAAGFLMRRWTRGAIAVGVLFHVGMLVFTGGVISWLFLYVMGAGFVAVAPWPETPLEIDYRGRVGNAVRRVLERLDPEGLYRWRPDDPKDDGASGSSLAVRGHRGSHVMGVAAWAKLLLVHPIVYAFLAGLVLWQALPGFVGRLVRALVGAGVA